MKVVSNEALTKLIQLIKSTFIKTVDTVEVEERELAAVATSGSYNDLSDKPTINTYTAGTGIDVTNNVISVASPTLTTVNSSKETRNVYYQLSNGLIISWGWFNNVPSGTVVTFPKAFTSSTSYGLCVTLHKNNTTETTNLQVNTTTATSFKIVSIPSVNVFGFYIAVGY